jgi:hypothetical protein
LDVFVSPFTVSSGVGGTSYQIFTAAAISLLPRL